MRALAYPDKVEGPGNHDDAGGPLLPDHPPEVADGRLRRTLGHDVGFGLNKALQKNREIENI